MKRRKLSNKTKGKLIIASVIVGIFALVGGFIFTRLISIVGYDVFVKNLRTYIELSLEVGRFNLLFAILAILIFILLTIILMAIVFPFLRYFLGKPLVYFMIWCFCRKNGFACRFHRAPFASLGGVKERSDIEIQVYKKTLHVHFVDIPFPWFRTFVLVNDREYRMHKSIRDKNRGFWEGRYPGKREIVEDMFNTYAIPKFPPEGKEFHYLVVDPSYADVKFIQDEVMLNVKDECSVGNINVCKLKVLKQRLNNEIFTPIK